MSEELFTDPNRTRSDLIMVERAIKKGWQIPDVVFENLPKVIAKIAGTGNNRERIRAASVLLAMNEANQKLEPPAVKHVEHHHTHQVTPVTAENIDERKQKLAARIARLSDNS
jgi:hypothetical protein